MAQYQRHGHQHQKTKYPQLISLKTVEIETTIKGINTSVSNVQNEQGKLTERVTKSEQTANGFKQSIESLTKKILTLVIN